MPPIPSTFSPPEWSSPINSTAATTGRLIVSSRPTVTSSNRAPPPAYPYLYENSFTEWGHPVSYLLLHDAGLELYRGALTILDERLDQAARWCLSALVPMIQRSIVDFQQDPTAANNVILDAADTLDGSSPLGDEGAREAVIQMGTLGIVGNGGDTTVGNFDLDRVDEVILHLHDEMPTMAGPVGLSADELVTNEFIDDDIGL